MAEVQVGDDRAGQRYEARVDGELVGAAYYELDGDRVVFTHTEVESAYEGQGVGSALARGALDDVRATGRKAVARCPFVQGWVDRHEEYRDLLA
jgi:uncharacterized protein